MALITIKPKVLLHFDNDTSVLDTTKDIVPIGTTLITGTNSVVPVKNHNDVKNKTFSLDNKAIQLNDNSQYDTSGSFTMKWAEYLTSLADGNPILSLSVSPTQGANYTCGLLFGSLRNGLRTISASNISATNTQANFNEIFAYTIPTVLNAWVQWELDYDVSTKKLYLLKDGILLKTWTLSVGLFYNASYTSYINLWGPYYGGTKGLIADFDFIKGTCAHTTNYTPDAISSTAINKTFVAGLTDANSKFGNAMYLDGNSYLNLPNYTLDTTNDFTISLNTFLTSCPTGSAIFKFNGDVPYDAGLLFGFSCSSSLLMYAGGNNSAAAWSLISNYNICTIASVLNVLVNWEIDYKDSTKTLYLFKDGVLINSWVLASRIYNGNFGVNGIGKWSACQTGYYDEFLILEGQCLHTSNFTLPNKAFNNSGQFLLKTSDEHYYNYNSDTTLNDLGITANNTATVQLYKNNGLFLPTLDQIKVLLAKDSKAKICSYDSDATSALPVITVTAIPQSDQFVYMKNDIDFKGISCIDWIHVNDGVTAEAGSGVLRHLASRDSGVTYCAYNVVTSNWDLVIDTANMADGSLDSNGRFILTAAGLLKARNNGMTTTIFNAAPWSAWTLDEGYKTVRFGYLISIAGSTDTAFYDALKYQYDGTGTWDLGANKIDYKVSTDNSSHTVTWLSPAGGKRAKINY